MNPYGELLSVIVVPVTLFVTAPLLTAIPSSSGMPTFCTAEVLPADEGGGPTCLFVCAVVTFAIAVFVALLLVRVCATQAVMVHPSNYVASAAAFTHEVEAMRESELKRFAKRLREFFKSFETLNFRDLSTAHLQKLVDGHNLSVDKLLTEYTKKLRNLK